MTDHPRLVNLRTASQIFREATSSFISNLPTFILLTILLFCFRTTVEDGTRHVTSFIDRDPSLKALLSRLDLAGTHGNRHRLSSPEDSPAALHRRRRRPFLHLTRVGTLDDDFFSGDDEDDRSPFGSNRKPSLNGSFVILNNFHPELGFSNPIIYNGINIPEIVRTGITFRADSLYLSSSDADNHSDNSDEREENETIGLEKGQDLDRVVDFHFLIEDSSSVAAMLQRCSSLFSSFLGTMWEGSRLGLKRLSGFILMRWAVRDALTQLLGLWYFGEIEDQYSFFKLFVRLKLMPFSIMSPWIRGYEKEISGFLFTWFLADTFVAFIFAVDAWVAIVDSRRTGREIMKEGCYLISTMLNQAVQIKCLEAIFCGSFVRWALARVFGRFLAMVFQSTVEVYFMVAWLIFYFAARCKDSSLQGRRFGSRELEALVDGLR
ncbi:hypothetical protein CJ030_MR2G012870 [Morella rubra]|uniref:Uncharacterized protein n=1 Tax=Morella rubra TaxID=262757 RepID=A0A6A1WF30_9ROSI|nr:hypothetical protein CJ030_MR2G012870 [Morella rubra]